MYVLFGLLVNVSLGELLRSPIPPLVLPALS